MPVTHGPRNTPHLKGMPRNTERTVAMPQADTPIAEKEPGALTENPSRLDEIEPQTQNANKDDPTPVPTSGVPAVQLLSRMRL